MLKIYEDELKALKEKMEKAELFANKIPVFKENIIKNKYTGKEQCISFGTRYKDLNLNWGIKRIHYISGTNCYLTNYPKENGEYDKYLFNVYVNTYSIFGDDVYNTFGLDEIPSKCEVFYYDIWNNTFYVEDEQIEEFLEKLYEWYLNVKFQLFNYRKQQKIKELEEQLNALKEGSE